ncbi:prolyl oligopeptidase family serine peptidase [Haliangium ochraceum]|uniref:prolyl oligopeptidase n=1 Tax=Haliangium ochraceum (strain DSM 14365 / JCM 11303 / SMP-2) TaxID=502025 RepID=D0LGM4_HALO1|nr:Prolyl oligopeptidase [Haliangium ochraceum DSM 14365]
MTVPPSPSERAFPPEQHATQDEEVELVYPETRREDTRETIHGVEVADPYRWLENADDRMVASWMLAQDGLARSYLEALPARDGLAARLRELNYYDAISVPAKRGERYFFTRRHADKEKSILYWRQGQGQEQVLIDPNTLSDDGSTSLGGWFPNRDGTKLAYKLNPNNADAATMYVMDVASGETSTVDVIDGAKYASAAWKPDGSGFYYTRLPSDPDIPIADLPARAEIRYHELGSDPAGDELVYPATGDPGTFLSVSLSRDGRYLMVSVQHGWNSSDVYFKDLRRGRDAGFEPLVTGEKAHFSVRAWRGDFYVLTNHEAPRYRIFKVDPRRPRMSRWREIVPESEAVIDSFNIVGNRLVVTYLSNAYSRMEVRSLSGQRIREVTLPEVGSVSNMAGNEDADEAFYAFTSFTSPPQIYRTSVATGESELWFEFDLPVDTSQFTAEQVWYPSRDGTQISMFLIRRKDLSSDQAHPTILYGYGGFNVNLTPAFSTNIVAWVERGGIYAIPNLRGGGEYGEEWHKAGMRLNKQNTFDDFLAAADFLIETGWTSPQRLAIWGGSNGGLLVGAAMTQAPEKFAAVVCAVPLLDMLRYHLFGSGKTWIPEYGSADDAAEFSVLSGFSPYHRVVEGTAYPALLMLSADSDDRVDPMHARKFTAAVQWASSSDEPAIMRIEHNSGHGGADMVRQLVERNADSFAFVADELGMAAAPPPAPAETDLVSDGAEGAAQ